MESTAPGRIYRAGGQNTTSPATYTDQSGNLPGRLVRAAGMAEAETAPPQPLTLESCGFIRPAMAVGFSLPPLFFEATSLF
jgi:hypothetical protein